MHIIFEFRMAPTPKKARMTNEVVSTAYCKAYLYEISWKKVFSDQIAGFLNKYAELKNTTIDIVSAMLLSNTAALLGPQTVIKFNEHQKLKANYYMIVVAERGLGKTPAYEELCYKVSLQKYRRLMNRIITVTLSQQL